MFNAKGKDMKFKWFIGIDVSKKTLDFHLRHQSEGVFHQQDANSKAGINVFLRGCKKYKVDFQRAVFCLEFTGMYNERLVETLMEKNLQVWVEQSLRVKRSLGLQRGKTDKLDAMRLSEYAYRFQDKCRLWQPAREAVRQLKSLVALRNRLLKARKMLNVPLKEMQAAGCENHLPLMRKLNKPVVKQLDKQLKSVETQIQQLIQVDEMLCQLEDIITSVEGVGPVTACQMIITTNEFKNITCSNKYACYAGVAPFDHRSGTSVKAKPRVSHLANKQVKQLLHMSALSATVMKGELHEYYKRKVAEGKNKMSVLNAIRNKLVLRIFACVKENRKYEKIYTYALA
jgi:transposase